MYKLLCRVGIQRSSDGLADQGLISYELMWHQELVSVHNTSEPSNGGEDQWRVLNKRQYLPCCGKLTL